MTTHRPFMTPVPLALPGAAAAESDWSDWAPDAENPLAEFSTLRRVPHGVTLLGRLFEEGTVARVGMALEREFGAWSDRPPGF